MIAPRSRPARERCDAECTTGTRTRCYYHPQGQPVLRRGGGTGIDRCKDENVVGAAAGGVDPSGSGSGADVSAGFVGLPELWDLGPSEVVSVVGGGGKTTLIERLARGYEAEGTRVVLTTTTKILPPDPGGRSLLLAETAADLVARLEAWRVECGRDPLVGASPVVGTRVLDNGKLDGVPREWVPTLRDLPWVGAVLIEADGAARLPLKAPAAWEPVIAASTSLTIVVAGLDAQDVVLDSDHVHRPELLAALLGLEVGQRLPSERLCEALLAGYEGRVPVGSRMLVFLNKLDACTPSRELLAAAATAPVEVWAGSARNDGALRALRAPERRPAAVILAAGLGTRMAAAATTADTELDLRVAKVLLRVGGRSLVGHAAHAALDCPALAAVAVVVGPDRTAVERELRAELQADAERLVYVTNPSPSDGQASSLRLGVAVLQAEHDPLVLLADQPRVTAETLGRVVAAAAAHPRAAGVGLAVAGMVGPPVLLHRSLRPQIAELTGDAGARTLVRRYAAEVVAVPAEDDEACDVDDAAGLQRARSSAAERS